MTDNPRWIHRPPGSNWGDFGPDDQNGRLNLITPEKVRQAVAEVREGLTFCLSLPLDLPGGNVLNPRRHPPLLRPTLRNGKPNPNYRLHGDNPMHSDVISDDLVLMHLQYSPQWDSFAHVGQLFDADGDGIPEPRCYNGWRPQVDIFGPLLAMAGKPDAHRLERTGAVLDGRDARLLQWITDSGLAVLIADNYAVEAHPAASQPAVCSATLPLHEHCLFKLGVHLGEIWHLTPLAQWLRANGRHRFLLTAPPLRLPGAVGSPVTPVATV